MNVFSQFIQLVCVCGVLRAVAGLISPENGMKNFADTAINVIIFAVIMQSILGLISSFF